MNVDARLVCIALCNMAKSGLKRIKFGTITVRYHQPIYDILFYRLPTEVMFSAVSVSLSVSHFIHRRGVPAYRASRPPRYRALLPSVPGPGPSPSPLPLYKASPSQHPFPSDTFKFVHYEAQTVGKRSVSIRLKYLLVII